MRPPTGQEAEIDAVVALALQRRAESLKRTAGGECVSRDAAPGRRDARRATSPKASAAPATSDPPHAPRRPSPPGDPARRTPAGAARDGRCGHPADASAD